MPGKSLARRTLLKGLGTAIALPWLDAMLPAFATAAQKAAALPPKRLAFLYIPNGVNMVDWTPAEEGADFALPAILEPLSAYKDQMLVLSGLTLDKARANGDGAGDHARSLAAFLTCRQPKKTHGADIRAGVSVDQVAAQHVGKQTKFASLEIGCDPSPQSGNCDSGYSCAYSSNASWAGESTPIAKEINPKLVFERLFVDPTQLAAESKRAAKEKYRKSILDLVRNDASRLQRQLGASDQRKLDEYLTAVREIEQRIERSANGAGATGLPEGTTKPAGIPASYEEHLRLMGDMQALAFQTDTTRISTFVLANEGSNRSYSFIDVPEGHHDLSHHGGEAAKKDKIRKINLFHIQQLAYLLERLRKVQEGPGTLLDNCMLIYGSGISDGNAHNHDDLPILVFGKGGGTLQPGRHVRYDKNTPLANLYLSLLDRFGVPLEQHGDSTGKLLNLDA